MNDETNLSSAVSLFIGRGKSAYPKEDVTRLIAAFGPKIAADLEPRVRGLLAELDQIKPDWKVHDLVGAAKWAVGKLKAQHPELDEEAVAALEWIYSWWWK
jgi:hypothetical protein